MIYKGDGLYHIEGQVTGRVTQVSGDKVWVEWPDDGTSVESLREQGKVWRKAPNRPPRPSYRWFGTSYQWTCAASGAPWVFDDGWGRYELTRYVRNPADERYDTGWYLTTPEDQKGEYMGKTVSAAAQAKETRDALLIGMLKRKDKR